MKTILLILLPAFSVGNYTVGKTHTQDLDPNKEASIRIKRACGIPDNVEWSDDMRMKYGKQIEKKIRENDRSIAKAGKN